MEKLSMEPTKSPDKAYDLLIGINQSSPVRGLPGDGIVADDPAAMQALTTAYITTLYFSALSNLQMQNTVPVDIDEMPRLKIAFERSYADYIAAATWLAANGTEYIATSTAYAYYIEVMDMDKDSVKSAAELQSPTAEIQLT
jgi:hypothetical protein